ncbi:MAG: peptidoglycan DD-metalloendopeptidase family protein [Deltaproteobacteria bacterium]|nr:peptidoglycan DD-metalloendopeptidase family protein [Deltaproteobacteria bacterium]
MKSPVMTAILALLVCGFGLPLKASGADPAPADMGESQRRLREIEVRIDESYQQLRDKEARERALRQDLNAVKREVAALEERIGREEAKAVSLRGEMREQEREIRASEAVLKRTENRLRERLRAIYKGDEATFLQVFFSSLSPDAAMENLLFMGKVVERDQELVAGYRSDRLRLENNLREMEQLQGRQLKILEGLKKDHVALEKAHALNRKLLAQVRRDKKYLSQEITALKDRAKQLGDLIRKLEREKSAEAAHGGGDFATQKGKLDWPVKGPVKIGFGTRKHPELETLYESQGIDIGTTGEQPMAVIWSGKVVFAKPFRGYGNLLIVNHGGGFHTLYAQASRLLKAVGDPVKKGEIVAISGFEGSRSVYFEIRHRGIPQDPLQWLSKE